MSTSRTKMRRRGALMVVLALAVTACGNGADEVDAPLPEAPQEQPADEDGDAADDVAAQDDPVSLEFAHVHAASHWFEVCGSEYLMDHFEDHDTISLQSFPGGQLGSEADNLESLVQGDTDLSAIGNGFFAEWYEPISIFEANYTFDSVDHMERVMTGPIGEELYGNILDEIGVRVLDTWYYGAWHLIGDEPFRHPDDLDGVTMRAVTNDSHIANTEALGANPTPVAFGEVYLALQQGVVDASNHTIGVVEANDFYEAVDYLSKTGHVIMSIPIAVSEQTWQRMSESQQQDLRNAVEEAGELVRECVEEGEQEILQRWENEGEVEVIDDVDVDAFRARSEEMLLDRFGDVWGDLYDRIKAES